MLLYVCRQDSCLRTIAPLYFSHFKTNLSLPFPGRFKKLFLPAATLSGLFSAQTGNRSLRQEKTILPDGCIKKDSDHSATQQTVPPVAIILCFCLIAAIPFPLLLNSKRKTVTPDGVTVFLVEEGGFEPPKSVTTDLQSAPFGRSGTPPYELGAGGRIRTPDLLITNQLLYQLSYTSKCMTNSRIYFTRYHLFCQHIF